MADRSTDDKTASSPPTHGVDAARSAFARHEWSEAYDLLTRLDTSGKLGAEDLERLAVAAYLVGRDAEYFAVLERAYHGFLVEDSSRAARCAFWLGLGLLFAGKGARANGWLARVQSHVDSDPEPNVHAGFLLLPQVEGQLMAGDWEVAQQMAQRAADIGGQFGDVDLRVCARHLLGRALLGACEVRDGFSILDEVMLDVAGGALSPIMTGLVYCSVIEACQQVFALARAKEWTEALAEWCESQPQMLAFSGTCLVHRAEILQITGKWPDAIHEARRACERFEKAGLRPTGAAHYQEAEVHRLRGDYESAENAYRRASQCGFEPQPGLALMRLAQGHTDVAQGAIRRLVRACEDPGSRARLLPACVEIHLAVGDVEQAETACRDLIKIASRFDSVALQASAAQAGAALAMAVGDAEGALGLARNAFGGWQQVEAHYESARSRLLAGMACKALDDDEGAALEFEAARALLNDLGAQPELQRLDRICAPSTSRPESVHGLTRRELEVLRHVASGETNKAIAAALCVSEKTIDRHLSNIFNKLDVSSRTAAAAYAFEHQLI